MRLFSPLPQLLVAGAALGGSLLPFAVGSAPTESKGIVRGAARRLTVNDGPIGNRAPRYRGCGFCVHPLNVTGSAVLRHDRMAP
jgi:hypothetical protein